MSAISALKGLTKAKSMFKGATTTSADLLSGLNKVDRSGIGPTTKAGLLAGGGLFAAQEVGAPIASGVAGTFDQGPLDSQIELETTHKLDLLAEQARLERLQASVAENMARLAHAAPDVYNQIMAGRRLPRGARVFGGSPRTDLLEELGAMMATGGIQPEPSAEEQMFEEMLNVNR